MWTVAAQEIKSRISITKAAFNKNQIELKLGKELVKSYTWKTALCGDETWTLWKNIRNTLRVLKCGIGEGWRRSVGLAIQKINSY